MKTISKYAVTLMCIYLHSLSLIAQTPQQSINTLTTPDISVIGGQEAVMPFMLDNTTDIVGIQFTIQLPDGFSYDTDKVIFTNRSDGHQAVINSSGNKYIVLIYSDNNNAFKGRSGQIFSIGLNTSNTLQEGETYQPVLSDVILSARNGDNMTTSYNAGKISILKSPDIVVSNITTDKTIYAPMDSMRIQWQVKNIGGTALHSGWTEYIWLTSDTNEKLITTCRMPLENSSFAAGEAVTRYTTAQLPKNIGLDGDVRVKIKVSPYSDSGEGVAFAFNNTDSTRRTIYLNKQLYLQVPERVNEKTDNVRCYLYRSGSTSEEQSFTFSMSDDRLVTPDNVTIPEGSAGTMFYLSVKDNVVFDDDSIAVLTVQGNGYDAVNEQIIINDDEQPQLTLSFDSNQINEGESVTFRISTDHLLNHDATILITSNYTSRFTFPSELTLAAGVSEVSSAIISIDDEEAGDTIVTRFIVSVEGLYSDTATLTVIENDLPKPLPDIRVDTILIDKSEGFSREESFTLSFDITNAGDSTLPAGAMIALYQNNSMLTLIYMEDSLEINQTKRLAYTLQAPSKAGQYNYHAVANYNHSIAESDYSNNTSAVVTFNSLPTFTVSMTTDKQTYLGGDTVHITGQLEGKDIANGTFELYSINYGYRHAMTITTDENGSFTYDYIPIRGQCGHFALGVCRQGDLTETEITGIDFYGLTVAQFPQVYATVDEIYAGTIELRNISNLPLTGVSAHVAGSSDCVLTFETMDISADTTVLLPFTLLSNIVSDGNSWETTEIEITSNEGVVVSSTIYYYTRVKTGKLYVEDEYRQINTTMTKGKTRDWQFTIYNVGQGETGKISLSLPDFMTAVTPPNMSSIASGGSATVILRFTPTDDMYLNVPVKGRLALNCENGEGLAIPYNIEPVSESIGTLTLDVYDETIQTEGEPHLEGAEVIIKTPTTGSSVGVEVASGTTNSDGIYSIELNEGYYEITIAKEHHSTERFTLLVNPKRETFKRVFLSYMPIDINYEVVRDDVEDKYEIIEQVTYETHVPLPIVTLEMPNINADNMERCQSIIVMAKLKNIGLIRADSITVLFPESNELDFTALSHQKPFSIEAKDSVFIPVKIRKNCNYYNGSGSGYDYPGTVVTDCPDGEDCPPNSDCPNGENCPPNSDCPDGEDCPSNQNCPDGENCPPDNEKCKYPVCVLWWIHCESDGKWHNNCLAYGVRDCQSPSDIVSISSTINKPIVPPITIPGKGIPIEDHALSLGCEKCSYSQKKCYDCTNDFWDKLNAFDDCLIDIVGLVPIVGEVLHIYQCAKGGFVAVDNPLNKDLTSCVLKAIPIVKYGVSAYEITHDCILPFFNDECLREPDRLIFVPCPECKEYYTNPLLKSSKYLRHFPTLTERYIYNSQRYAIINTTTGKPIMFSDISSDNSVYPSFINEYIKKIEVVYDAMMANLNLSYALTGDTIFELASDEELKNLSEFISTWDGISENIWNYKPKDVPESRFSLFVERWHNTILNIESDNVIDTLAIKNYLWTINISTEYAQSLDYESIVDMFNEETKKVQEELNSLSSSVCSVVKLQISQNAVMTREAFLGTLTVKNQHETEPLKDVKLTLKVTSKQTGKVATSHEFQINVESLDGFSGNLSLDNGWEISPDGTGIAKIRFIPTKYAAPTEPVVYSFGGTLSCTDPYTGTTLTYELVAPELTVSPSPNMELTYFMQRDILGDDPLTTDTVEVIEEAEFAMLINNKGYGTAKKVIFTTHTPEIIENEKGLLIDFDIVRAAVAGKEVDWQRHDNTITTDFGNIPPLSTTYAQWYLTSTLLGHFVNYDVKLEHLTSYGNPDLSLFDTATIHEMIRSVDVPSYSPSIIGWLVNDIEDADDTPDIIYRSDGTTSDVGFIPPAKAVLSPDGNDKYTLTVTATAAGWIYGNVTDPTYGLKKIDKIIRNSDGAEISTRNFWQTDRTLRDGKDPLYENRLHFADSLSSPTESYTISFAYKARTELDILTITGISNNEQTNTAVSNLTILFNKPILASSLTTDDLRLTCNGKLLDNSLIEINHLDDDKIILDIHNITTEDGHYQLTVKLTTIMDQEGYGGKGDSKTNTITWEQYLSGQSNITFSVNDISMGKITGASDGTYDYNTELHADAISADNCHFIRWTDGCTDPTRTIIVGYTDAEYTAEFAYNKYKVTYLNYDGTQLFSNSFVYGSIPQYNAEQPTRPATNQWIYTFTGWAAKTAPTEKLTELPTVTSQTTYIALYDSTRLYSLVLIPDDETKGQVYGSGIYANGTNVSIKAVANEGYKFIQWSDGIANALRTIIVDNDINLTAEFGRTLETKFEESTNSELIYINGRIVNVNIPDEIHVKIYTVVGQLVYHGTDRSITLPQAGTYIIQAGTQNIRITVL